VIQLDQMDQLIYLGSEISANPANRLIQIGPGNHLIKFWSEVAAEPYRDQRDQLIQLDQRDKLMGSADSAGPEGEADSAGPEG
jgi:hypothetical protein